MSCCWTHTIIHTTRVYESNVIENMDKNAIQAVFLNLTLATNAHKNH